MYNTSSAICSSSRDTKLIIFYFTLLLFFFKNIPPTLVYFIKTLHIEALKKNATWKTPEPLLVITLASIKIPKVRHNILQLPKISICYSWGVFSPKNFALVPPPLGSVTPFNILVIFTAFNSFRFTFQQLITSQQYFFLCNDKDFPTQGNTGMEPPCLYMHAYFINNAASK